MDKIASAQRYMLLKSKAIVLNAIESGDLTTAKWYLTKYEPIVTKEETKQPLKFEPGFDL